MINLFVRLFVKDYKNVNDNKVRERYGMLAGIMGIVLNVLLFACKLFAGMITASIAITADAFNNLTDAGSSVISMIGFKLANKPVDRKHPFGHGRMEYLSGLLVSIIIILVGFELIKSSVGKIFNPAETVVTPIVFVILGVSVLVKLWMFLYNRKLGKRIKSAGMKATATDCISDSVATLVVLISAAVGDIWNVSIDGYVGALVALFILFAGIRSAKETIDALLGEAPDPELVKQITEFVMSYDVVVGVHDFIFHNYGVGRELVSLHAEVPCNEGILLIHERIDQIESDLAKQFGIQAVIHMDPVEVNNEVVCSTKQMVVRAVKQLYGEATVHDFRMVSGENRRNLIFDVVIPYSIKDDEQTVTDKISRAVSENDPTCFCVIKIDRPFV